MQHQEDQSLALNALVAEDETDTIEVSQPNSAHKQMSSHNKSVSTLPPPPNQNRVSKIRNALAQRGADDDLERAPAYQEEFKQSNLNFKSHSYTSPHSVNLQKSTLSRGSSHNVIDQECEKLKESYTQHRKQRNSQSRERSKSGLRSGANSRSIGRQALANESTFTQVLEKENAADLRNSATSQSFQNKYKRNQSNQKSLQNYQEKYNKLEQNFKKFTQNLQEKRTNSASGRFAFQTINQSSAVVTNMASSFVPAAVAQPNQQSSFGPI